MRLEIFFRVQGSNVDGRWQAKINLIQLTARGTSEQNDLSTAAIASGKFLHREDWQCMYLVIGCKNDPTRLYSRQTRHCLWHSPKTARFCVTIFHDKPKAQ